MGQNSLIFTTANLTNPSKVAKINSMNILVLYGIQPFLKNGKIVNVYCLTDMIWVGSPV